MPAVDVEAADGGLTRDLGLELLIEMIFDDRPTAIGALRRRRRVVCFVDLVGRRRQAMGVPAMLVTWFASGLFGLLLGRAWGERRRLPLGLAFGFFQAFLEIAQGLFQPVDAPIALGELLAQLLIFETQLRVRRRVHADLDSDTPCQLSESIVVSALNGKWALNKDNSDLRRRMGVAGRRRFEEQFTWEVVIDKYYRPLLTAKRN
jgi:hypothetical protein